LENDPGGDVSETPAVMNQPVEEKSPGKGAEVAMEEELFLRENAQVL
jgi:hypothetical protein